jgi:hypothetical protein
MHAHVTSASLANHTVVAQSSKRLHASKETTPNEKSILSCPFMDGPKITFHTSRAKSGDRGGCISSQPGPVLSFFEMRRSMLCACRATRSTHTEIT